MAPSLFSAAKREDDDLKVGHLNDDDDDDRLIGIVCIRTYIGACLTIQFG